MSRDDLAQLRALAGEKGFDLERATMRKHWRLVDEATGELAKNENGSAAFTVTAAIRFLRRLPEIR
jgi:hypothetical protein